jgi:ABC-type nitrate/sulfonate/bicarbonate transport system permease component
VREGDDVRTDVAAPTATLPEQERASGRSRLARIIFSDRAARWTSRLGLLLIWQAAAKLSDRFPTPFETARFLVEELQRAYGGQDWSIWNNELVHNLAVSLLRTGTALVVVVLIGVPLGFAMGRWWRIQAFFTDIVTVGLALPAFIWALLAVMWFGFGHRAAIFCAIVSATPGLVVLVLQGSLALPRDLRDMSDAYRVPLKRQIRELVLPSMAGALIAGIRLAIVAAWGCVILVEWFGNNEGAGFRARYWYLATDYNGLMGWGLIVLVVVITIDRGIIERVDQRVHRWRGAVGGFGSGRAKRT